MQRKIKKIEAQIVTEEKLIEVAEKYFINNPKEKDMLITKAEEFISRTEAEFPSAEVSKPRYKTYRV